MDKSMVDPMEEETLLHNVFSYDLRMMKEQFHSPRDPISVEGLIEMYDNETHVKEPNVDFAREQHSHKDPKTNKRTVKSQTNTPPLLFNVFNYDLGMMRQDIHQVGNNKRVSSSTNVKKYGNVLKQTSNKTKARNVCKEKNQAKMMPLTPTTPDACGADHISRTTARTPLSPLSSNMVYRQNSPLNANTQFSLNVPFPNRLPPNFNSYSKSSTGGSKIGSMKENVEGPNFNRNFNRTEPLSSSKQSVTKSQQRKGGASPLQPKFGKEKNVLVQGNRLLTKPEIPLLPVYRKIQSPLEKTNRGKRKEQNDSQKSSRAVKKPCNPLIKLSNVTVKELGRRQYKDDIDFSYVADFDSDQSDVQSDDDFVDDFPFPEICNETPGGTEAKPIRCPRKGKQPIAIPPCTLNFSENERHSSSSQVNNDTEFSFIAELQSDQSDGDSEDDNGGQFYYEHDEETRETVNVLKDYTTLGPPNVRCNHCQAWMWKEERVNKSVVRGQPIFSLCCAKGQIKLPKEKPTPSYIWQLHNDKEKSKGFTDGIRLYNSLFAFTSTGGKVDHSINNGGAPYIYRLNGQNHHLFGSLIPEKGADPKFCQLYIYDTQNEISNRLKWVNVADGEKVDIEIVEGLSKMLEETNELVQEFRQARDRFEEHGVQDLEVILKVCRSESGRENHVGPSDEVAGIMVGDLDDTDGSRDIVIDSKITGLERISDIHPKLMALQYPVLFPHGCDGFHKKNPFGKVDKVSEKKREMITQKEYYSYKFQVRTNEGTSLSK